jgi:hypothetical protein
MPELGIFGIKLTSLLLSAPFAGFGLLKLSEVIEKAWKSGNVRKKWIAMSFFYFALAVLSGVLR